MNKTLTLTLAVAVCAAFTLAPASADVIVTEGFGGDNAATLNTTTAETFDGGITAAGGSDTWAAGSFYRADGTVGIGNQGLDESAYLSLGSYINDRKGSADGKFTASATLDVGGLGSWLGFGFFKDNAPNVADTFVQDGAAGSGIFIYRDDRTLDGFAGYKSTNNVDGGSTTYSGSQLLTIVLDLTPDGGYDGSTNFGDITFYVGDADTGTSLGTHEYASDRTFGSFGLTAISNSVLASPGSVSSLQLEQVVIPEPASLALIGLGGLLIVTRRRG